MGGTGILPVRLRAGRPYHPSAFVQFIYAHALTPPVTIRTPTIPRAASKRESVRAARVGKDRQEVVVALAREVDRLQQSDRKRLAGYQRASRRYLDELHKTGLSQLPLLEAHQRCCDLALEHLPQDVGALEE